ncbi:nucleoside recognition domain-containing protein [Halothermothrix orenii]|uniref:Ferrous iron transport protein FeoB n=1 Tax=Halothermothrix orenii (strain H 168 / OCM 544 / DSM 9562) TaxID=373903 RepID=B8D1F4_HALOH|nr:nucleoside recognition domain-containing protein [Halothermothrix orenii]ACL69031.1 Ferrous iron transport protein FeoB [Halothermothrix orenii H 168]
MELVSSSVKIKNIFKEVDNKFTSEQKKLLRDQIVKDIYSFAETIARKTVKVNNKKKTDLGEKIDDILTSKWLGFPIMLLMLGGVFWLTIAGANVPSALLAKGLFWIEGRLSDFFIWIKAPEWLHGILVLGVYRTMAWVVSVMLPPMAIFFPLFTLMEDLGYLPRVAFNLDNFFKKAGAHGKQSLTMSMGFGCNAAGVISARIIDSPREKLIAIITNNFVPCNGRFPTLIILATIFMGTVVSNTYSSFIAAATVVGLVLFGIIITLVVSWGLSKTVLKGVPSSFTLELPPYRKPQIGRVLVRSFLDRTLFVLGRAVIVAAPAGAIVWIFANVGLNGVSLIDHVANLLDPFAVLIGLDGFILLAFILGLPANEIVIPILVMSYLSAGTMLEPESANALRDILVNNGWTWVTALATMLFSLLHFPCGTTLLTIRKETQSIKWTIFTFILTTSIAIVVTFVVVQLIELFGLIL